jgi:hypothetical protein
MAAFWDIAPCSLVVVDWRRQYALLKRRWTHTRIQSAVSQKAVIFFTNKNIVQVFGNSSGKFKYMVPTLARWWPWTAVHFAVDKAALCIASFSKAVVLNLYRRASLFWSSESPASSILQKPLLVCMIWGLHTMEYRWRSSGLLHRVGFWLYVSEERTSSVFSLHYLRARWRRVVSFTAWLFYLGWISPGCPLERRLGGPQGRNNRKMSIRAVFVVTLFAAYF